LAAHPEAQQGHEGFAGLALGQAGEEEVLVDAVEKGADVGVGDEGVAEFAAFADAGDGAVDGAAGAVAVAAFEELLFEGAGEAAGDGGLEDAVADGGNQEGAGAGFGGAGALFDDDFEEGVGAVAVFLDAEEEVREVAVEALGEGVDGDAVGAGAAFVFTDAVPGLVEVVGGEGRSGRGSSERIAHGAVGPEELDHVTEQEGAGGQKERVVGIWWHAGQPAATVQSPRGASVRRAENEKAQGPEQDTTPRAAYAPLDVGHAEVEGENEHRDQREMARTGLRR